MTEPHTTTEDVLEVRVIEPSDDCNLYTYEPHVQRFRLAGVHHATERAPVDRAVIVDTSSGQDTGIQVLLMSQRAILPGCMVSARPLALLHLQGGDEDACYIIAEPVADPDVSPARGVTDISPEKRQALHDFITTKLDGRPNSTLLWEDGPSALAFIHEARRAARLAQIKTARHGIPAAAWKPLGYRASGARRGTDIEPHTESEYAYHQLPYRFQHYVDEYLAPNERILFAVNRPAMKSALRRDWLKRGEMLQAGILLVTDQQVVLVTEIIPPDQSSIRYGYIAHAGVPERIDAANVLPTGDNVCLEVTWQAASGVEHTLWEFPHEATSELQAAADILRGWQPRADDRRLRRVNGAEPVEIELRDLAANDPAAVIPLAARLAAALQARLEAGERELAHLLIPAWAREDRVARVLGVTDQRVLLVPDPQSPRPGPPEVYRLRDVSSLKLKSSILDSWLLLRIAENGDTRSAKIGIPSTAPGFEALFIALRQQLVATPTR